MTLKRCKTCGNPVASSVRQCPHCGVYLWTLGRQIWAALLVIFVLPIIYYMAQQNEKLSSSPTSSNANDSEKAFVMNPNDSGAKNVIDNIVRISRRDANPARHKEMEPEEVSLATLLAHYKENEVRADSVYRSKIIQITGRVGDIKKDIVDRIYVTLGTGQRFEIPMAQCFFHDKYSSNVSQLNKGDIITIQGRVKGLMMNVLMEDCSLVQHDNDNSKSSKDPSEVKLIDVPNSDATVKIILQHDKIEPEYAKQFKVARFDIDNDGREDILYTFEGSSGSCGYSWNILINKGDEQFLLSECCIPCTGQKLKFSNDAINGMKTPYFKGNKVEYFCKH